MKRSIKYILALFLIGAVIGTVMADEIRRENVRENVPSEKTKEEITEDVKENIVLKISLPKVPSEVFALKIEDENIDTQRSKKIAEDILGLGIATKNIEDKKLENGRGIVLTDKNNEEAEITIYKRGQLRYLSGKEWNEKYRQDDMLGEEQAKDKALGYVNKLVGEDLLTKSMVDSSKLEVAYDEIYTYDSRNGKIEKYVSNQHVNLETSYDGIPLRGAGAKVRVYLGKGGVVTGVLNFVGKIKSDKKVSVITPQEAVDKLKADGYKNMDIESMEFVYYVPPLHEDVNYIYPAYDIKGKIHMRGSDIGFAQMIPATK